MSQETTSVKFEKKGSNGFIVFDIVAAILD